MHLWQVVEPNQPRKGQPMCGLAKELRGFAPASSLPCRGTLLVIKNILSELPKIPPCGISGVGSNPELWVCWSENLTHTLMIF